MLTKPVELTQWLSNTRTFLSNIPEGSLTLMRGYASQAKSSGKKKYVFIRKYFASIFCEDIQVYVLYGATGCWKSRWAGDHYPSHYSVPPPQRGSWWFDKYEGEEEILLDEYGGEPSELLPWNFFLKFLDGYLMQVPYKGGHYWFKPKVIIITSNFHPKTWYPARDWAVLDRRITHIFYFHHKGAYRIEKQPSHYSSLLHPEGSERQEEGAPEIGVPTTEGDNTSLSHLFSPEEVERMLMSDESLAQNQ